MTRHIINMPPRTFPDRPSVEPAPRETLPTVEQRWWFLTFAGTGKAVVVDEHNFTVADNINEDTARHIVQVHNKSIGVPSEAFDNCCDDADCACRQDVSWPDNIADGCPFDNVTN